MSNNTLSIPIYRYELRDGLGIVVGETSYYTSKDSLEINQPIEAEAGWEIVEDKLTFDHQFYINP